MININKYNTLDDYLVDSNVPFSECRVSQIGPSGNLKVMYDLPNALSTNRVLNYSQIGAEEVCAVVKDLSTGEIGYIPIDNFSRSTLDTALYELKPYIRFHAEGRKQFMISPKNADVLDVAGNSYPTGNRWATANMWKITPDLTQDGGFTLTAKVNDAVKTATVSWTAGSTTISALVSSIRTDMEQTAVISWDFVSGVYISDGGDTINVGICSNNGNSESYVFTNATNATITDLSKTFRYNGVEASTGTHHDWQATYVATILASFTDTRDDFRTLYGSSTDAGTYTTANYAVYGKDGSNPLGLSIPVDLKYRCGINLAKHYTWAYTNGGSRRSYIMDNNGPVSRYVFSTIPSSGTEAEKAFYDSLDGTSVNEKYRSYLATRMMDTASTGSVNKISRDNGVEVTKILSSLETQDFDGAWIPCYPAARAAYDHLNDTDLGRAGIPTAHEIGIFMRDDKMQKINSLITELGITGSAQLSYGTYYWSSVEYSTGTAWCYYASYGTLSYTGKYYRQSVCPVLVFEV